MPLFRATMTWTGFTGSPGYTNLHFLDPDETPSQIALDSVTARCRTFFEALKATLPGSVRIDYPTALQRIDTGTGDLLEDLQVAAVAQTAGTGLTTFSSATGACITWRTVGVLAGRRVIGRTFIVPIASGSYDTDGTLNNTSRTTINTAATAFIGPTIDMVLAIWHRPTTGGTDGAAYDVTTASVRDKTAVLRSRRD